MLGFRVRPRERRIRAADARHDPRSKVSSVRRLLKLQQVRFLVAGCANTTLDFVLLNTLSLLLGLPVLVANSISVVIGISLSYFLNHYFVFRYPERVSIKKFAAFFGLTGFSSLVIQNGIIYLFELLFDTRFGNSLLFLPDAESNHVLAINAAKAVAVLVGLVWNFCVYKFIVFRKPLEHKDGPLVVELVEETTPVVR